MTDADSKPDFTQSEIVAMAWDDETSFDAIERATGMAEKDVIKLMRSELKLSSFKLWRARVSGRKAKHDGRMR
ncbi:MAG: TIGR03643 family protein [Pseudomonadota bacterium]